MKPVILTSAYLAPVHYYTKLYSAPYVYEERNEFYVKQTYRNRCMIAGPDGPLALTIPVEHGDLRKPLTREVRISEHGNWRHLHWNALCSAYDGSPFFEYYADDFRPLYEKRFDFLVDFNEALQQTVCEALDLHPQIERRPNYIEAGETDACDFRETIRPKVSPDFDPLFSPVPYYQVFGRRTGFLPNLSIVDLLFNMGPEARLVLRDSQPQQNLE